MQGKILRTEKIDSKIGKVEGLNLMSGNYICIYLMGNEIVERKIITIAN